MGTERTLARFTAAVQDVFSRLTTGRRRHRRHRHSHQHRSSSREGERGFAVLPLPAVPVAKLAPPAARPPRPAVTHHGIPVHDLPRDGDPRPGWWLPP